MRLIDADALIDDLEHDVAIDQDTLDYEELTEINRTNIQFDKDCKQNAIDLLRNAPTIEPEPHWIPCSERLPKIGGAYIVTVHLWEGKKQIGLVTTYAYWRDATWWNFEQDDVIAWMDMPKPYQKEGDQP